MINVGIVGTGLISFKHIEAYLKFPDRCRIVAMADPMVDRAREYMKKYNIECEVFADAKRLAEAPGVDLVSICTPPSTHAELARAFLLGGKHVLLEKPMAASLKECDAILDAERQSGKRLAVVAQNRFQTVYMRMKKILESGMLGRLNYVQVHSFWWRTMAYYDMDWRGTWEHEGGGCTLNHSVHQIDLMLWLVGMPCEVTATLANVAHANSEVEDVSMAHLRFTPHGVGQITSSLVHYGEDQSILVQMEKAAIAMPWKVVSYKPNPGGFPLGPDEECIAKVQAYYDSLPEVVHEKHFGQIDDMLAAIETGRPPLTTGVDAKNAINVIQGIYKSAFDRRPVDLPLADDDAFYTQRGLLDKAIRYNRKQRKQ